MMEKKMSSLQLQPPTVDASFVVREMVELNNPDADGGEDVDAKLSASTVDDQLNFELKARAIESRR